MQGFYIETLNRTILFLVCLGPHMKIQFTYWISGSQNPIKIKDSIFHSFLLGNLSLALLDMPQSILIKASVRK